MEELSYFIQTFGCHANIIDSQKMAGTLDALGLVNEHDFRKADVVIINTCSVRQKSEDKVYGWGMKLGKAVVGKEVKYIKKGNQIIFVTGCMVGSAKGERKRHAESVLKSKMPWASYFLSPEEEHLIPQILVENKVLNKWALTTLRKDSFDQTKYDFGNKSNFAYVNVSTGCDNFCTFCVVPYSRGKEISRREEDIINEINHLVDKGINNIMLVGQNVNSWGLDKESKFKLRIGCVV